MTDDLLLENQNPWLSVIVPTYNGAAYLAQTLQSVVLQHEPSLEVIVVDDGSTDETREIVESFSSELTLRCYYREHTGNWVTQSNFALREARGKYVSILHQDDVWLENRLSVLKGLTQQFSEAVLFLHPSWFISEDGRQVGKWSCPFPNKLHYLSSEFLLPRLIVQNFISIPAPLFSRDSAMRAGLLDDRLWFTADWKFWLSLARQGAWVYSPEPLSCFRIHHGSQTILGSKNSADFLEQLTMVQQEQLPFLPAVTDQTRKLAAASTKINYLLARVLHGERTQLIRLLLECVKLGPRQLAQLWNYSRIFERISSRVRAGLI